MFAYYPSELFMSMSLDKFMHHIFFKIPMTLQVIPWPLTMTGLISIITD